MTYPNLYHLAYFVDAVELGSVTAAAKKNSVSHPAISQAIRSLESHFHQELILHQKKNFEVTQQGYLLARKAKPLLLHSTQLTEILPQSESEIEGTVVLGMSRSIANAFLSSLLKKLEQKHPRIQLKIRFGSSHDMIERTVSGLTDLSLTIGYHAMPTLKQNLTYEGNFVVIQPAEKSESSPTSDQFILTKPQYETEVLKKSYQEQFKKRLPLKLEVGSWDMISRLVSDGHGMGLVPDISVTPTRLSKIKVRKTPWYECQYEIFLNERIRNKKGPAQDAVADHIRSILGKLK